MDRREEQDPPLNFSRRAAAGILGANRPRISPENLAAWRQAMKTGRTFRKITVFLSVMLLLAGAVHMPRAAWASMEDAAIFYEELDQHGEWVEYEHYGPVWYPTQVQENWRPYVDGRWTPADEGYVFETQEPWGWATYHYGNWMPTEEYGWVWVPGRTWYPNTVTWRTSPESASPDDSYIGWAPIPPPNYTPQPGYYPEGYYGGSPYGGPFENLITAPFWIFVKAASFLLGFSEPYAPTYSYWGCGCLAPPPVVPYYYNRTVVVHNYCTPDYYPRGIWAGRGYYNWGPPLPYVSRVTRIKQVNINNYVRQVNIYQRRNVAPPPGILARRAYFRQVVPPAMVKRRPLPRGVRVRDVHRVRGNLVRPHLVKANLIKDAPAIRGHIPKHRVARRQEGEWRRGVPGAALPASAMLRPDRQMENRVRKIPPSQRIQPVSPQARQWHAPRTPRAAATQPTGLHQRRGSGPNTAGWTPRAASPGTASPRVRPGPQGTRATVSPGTPEMTQETRGRRQRAAIPGGGVQAPSPSQAAAPPSRGRPGKDQQPGAWRRQQQAPAAGIGPGQPPGQGQKPRYTPGRPAPRAAAPARVQPQHRAPAVKSTPRPQPKGQPKQGPAKEKYTPGQSRRFGSGGAKMSGMQPRPRQYQPQAPRQVRQQRASPPRARIPQQARPHPKAEVRQLPRQQPRPQVRQQTRSQPRPQVRQQPRARQQRQVRQQPRPKPQVRQQARSRPQRQVWQQARPQPRPQVRQQSRQKPRPQAQKRHQDQPQERRQKQLSQHN